MKRLIILMVSVFANMYCFAGGLKVKEGSAAFLKEKVNAVVEFDFSTTTWEKMRILKLGVEINMKSACKL